MLTIVREEGANITHSQDPAAVPALLAKKDGLFWVDLESPTADEFQLLHEVFNFHPLAVEDAMRPHQRPKVDEFEGYFFLVELGPYEDMRADAQGVIGHAEKAKNKREQ